MRPRGLFLVTGPTGSGKTTTLATIIDYINRERADHIITIEDPIEYVHPHRKCIVTQREIHNDVPGFAEALRRALRQDPDIILVGEMRDLETIGAAVTAAETGHLVMTTLHTRDASKTAQRIVTGVAGGDQDIVREQLAMTLEAVISQELLPRADGKGVVVATEILVATPAVRQMIRENKLDSINDAILAGKQHGRRLKAERLYQLKSILKYIFCAAGCFQAR